MTVLLGLVVICFSSSVCASGGLRFVILAFTRQPYLYFEPVAVRLVHLASLTVKMYI